MATTKKPATEIKNVFRGTFIHSTEKTPLQILEGALLGVDGDGKVRSIIFFALFFFLFLKIYILTYSNISVRIGVKSRQFTKVSKRNFRMFLCEVLLSIKFGTTFL